MALRILGVLAAILVTAFVIFRVPDTDAKEMWTKYGGEPSQRLQLADGRTVHLRDEGPRDAPAIVLLHGSMPGVGTALSQVMPRSLIERSLSQSVSNQAVVTPEAVDRYWEMTRYPDNRAATRGRFGTERVPVTAEAVGAVDVPTLVMWGEEHALVPFAAAAWFMEHLTNATLVSYPGIGHLPMEEAPVESVQDLRDWLSSQGIAEQVDERGTGI